MTESTRRTFLSGLATTTGTLTFESNRAPSSSCVNGDLETGTFAGWQGFYGSRLNSPTINTTTLSSGIINGRHTIMSPGFDPVLLPLGVQLPMVGEGSYSARLGNSSTNGEADFLSYTFTVNAQNQNFSFRYAVVLENPNHQPSEQPFFGYYVVRGTSISNTLSNLTPVNRYIVADPSNPFLKTAGDIVYREWTPTCVDLSAYLNQTVTIVFYTADCSLGGHFGYAYIDGLCVNNDAISSFTMPTEICAGATLLADGSASSNEISYFWSIEESDANWGRNPSTEVSQWFVAQHAGPIDLTSFYASKGGKFKCNMYYRIKLAVSNDCTPWNETVQLLHVRCPVVSAGPDLCVSCKPNGKKAQLGTGNPNTPGVSYVWSPAAGLSDPTSPSPYHLMGYVTYPFTYTVTATDSKGCTSSDQVTLYCSPPAVEIDVVPDCCKVTLNAVASGYDRIVWSTGATGVSSIDVTSAGTYSVTASNVCGSKTATVTVTPQNVVAGFFNPIAYNSLFSLSGVSGYPDKLYVKDVTAGNPPGIAGVPHSYNATDYKLELFDRWGNLFKTLTDHNCQGFPNWSIAWDGTGPSGSPVQEDVYVFKLSFKNCQYTNWTYPNERKFARTCVSWATLFGIKLWCKEYQTYIADEQFVTGSVTVIG